MGDMVSLIMMLIFLDTCQIYFLVMGERDYFCGNLFKILDADYQLDSNCYNGGIVAYFNIMGIVSTLI